MGTTLMTALAVCSGVYSSGKALKNAEMWDELFSRVFRPSIVADDSEPSGAAKAVRNVLIEVVRLATYDIHRTETVVYLGCSQTDRQKKRTEVQLNVGAKRTGRGKSLATRGGSEDEVAVFDHDFAIDFDGGADNREGKIKRAFRFVAAAQDLIVAD
jgi:hypothetical protein